MRFLLSTAPFFQRPVDEAFKAAAGSGFTEVEVMISHDPVTQDATSLFAAASTYGLTVGAIHAPFLLLTRGVLGRDPIGKVERSVAIAEEIGTPLVVVHPPYRWQGRYRRWLAEEAPEISDRVTVAVENMPHFRPAGFPAPRLHVEGRHPAAVLDTSHAAVAGADVIETARSLGRRLSHVHLSNNAGKGWDSHLPLDEGILPIGDLLLHLDDNGYEGSVSLEFDLRRWMNNREALDRVLARNRDFCQSMMTSRSSSGGSLRPLPVV